MLKATGDRPPERQERSFGELASQLVDDAKAYARAEVDLVKAIAADKSKPLRVAAILLVAATFVAMAALNALCVGLVIALATLIGPLLAGIVTFVLVAAAAGLIGWIGVSKLRESL